MKTCSAYFCKNTSKNPSIRFYKFPETAVRSEWVKAMRCKRAPGKKAYVCSAHFEDDCYIKKTIKLNRIRDDAIPTIFSKLPPSYSTPVNSSELLKENEMDVYPTYKSFRNDSTYTPNLLDIKIEKSESLLNLEEYEILKERDPSAEEFCRLCLGKLYSGRVPIWEDRDISERICKCTSIQVLPTDYLKFICALCSENIMKINAFQEMCVQSNEAFENYKYRYRDMTDSPFPKIKEEIETSEEVTAEIEYESECDFKFTNDFCDSEKFEKEENEKTGVDELFCEVCPMVCYDPGEMEAHLRSHETRTIFHCSFPKCDKVFERYKECKKHYRDHYTEDTVLDVCPFCGKTSKTRLSIGKHIRDNHTAKNFTCEICKKGYSSRHALLRHKDDIHRDSPPFPCPKCSVVLKSDRGLTKHFKNVHYKSQQLHCPYCDRAFSTGYNLRSHMRTHTGETPFVCPDCGQQFRHHVTMKQHRLTVHQVNMFDRPPDDIFAQMKGRRKKKERNSTLSGD